MRALVLGAYAFFIGGGLVEEWEIEEHTCMMERALELAQLAEGDTSPNPMVGCVLTDEMGEILAEGYHHKAGEPHAEIMALNAAMKKRVADAIHTAYVTLEPCSHYGRTGPCCDALIRAGVQRVVIATKDPNPLVAGQGIERLKKAGIEVIVGILEAKAQALNDKFFWWITKQRPFISLKYAMTMDGKIATATGDSKWITGEEAREHAHFLRKTHDAILVGVDTVIADDPELTTRMVKGKNPLRIVLDTHGRTPLTSNVLQGMVPTWIVVGKTEYENAYAKFGAFANVQVVAVNEIEGHIDIQALVDLLGEEHITSLLVEGGSKIHGAFLQAQCFNKIYAFIAPKVVGGSGITPMGGRGCEFMDEAVECVWSKATFLGEDILLVAERKME